MGNEMISLFFLTLLPFLGSFSLNCLLFQGDNLYTVDRKRKEVKMVL